MPNGATRAPNAARGRNERLADLTEEQREKFLPLCPDFAIELCSPSDRLTMVQGKMAEYIDNGLQLGWLIDPANKTVYVYTPDDNEPKILTDMDSVDGEPVLPGFVVDLSKIW